MSIVYLVIVDVDSKDTIGIYEHADLKEQKLKKEIEEKSSELISQIKTEISSVKKGAAGFCCTSFSHCSHT